MRDTTPRAGRSVSLIALAILLTALLLSGCSLGGGGDAGLVSVADNTGFYHVKVPSTWSYRVDPGIISIYAAEELPESEVLEDPVILLFLSEIPTEDPIDEVLVTLVEDRAAARQWKSGADLGDTFDLTMGERPAVGMHVVATDAGGVDFQAEFWLARTAGREVLAMAVAPAGEWDDFALELDALRTQWFWHLPDSASVETTVAE